MTKQPLALLALWLPKENAVDPESGDISEDAEYACVGLVPVHLRATVELMVEAINKHNNASMRKH